MPLTLAFGLLLALGGLAQEPAQEKPDFSGEWILVSPSEPPAGTARKLTVAHDAASVRITRVSESGSASAAYELNPAAGTVSGTSGTDAARASTTSKGKWTGSSLTLDDTTCRRLVTVRSAPSIRLSDAEACEERSEVWSAGPKPGLLTIEITTRGPEKRVSSATFVYRRPEH
jgi:hypothetical protein